MSILTSGCWEILSLTRKKTSYNDKTWDSFNILPTKLITLLVRCSNVCKSLKKKIQKVVRPTWSPRQQWPPLRTKSGELSLVFSVQRTGGSPTGPDLGNMVGDQDTGSTSRPISSGLQVPGEPGFVVKEQDHLGGIPLVFFFQNILQLHQQR